MWTIYRDTAAFDKTHEELKVLCKEAPKNKIIIIFRMIDLKSKKEVRIVIVMKVDKRTENVYLKPDRIVNKVLFS